MSAPKKPKLKACPFCGSKPVIRRTMEEYDADSDGDVPAGEFECRVSVDCDTCGISHSEEYRADAIAIWNLRTRSS